MILPNLSISGTAAEDLAAQAEAIKDAALELQRVLEAGSPNARDYGQSFWDAIREYERRHKDLREIMHWADAVRGRAQEAIDYKAARRAARKKGE